MSRSSLRIALMTSRPPGSRFLRASTIGVQAGVVSMMAWSLSGASSAVSPAQVAPSSRAKARSASARAKTKTSGCRVSVPHHLQDQVRRGAEAGQPQVLSVLEAGQSQRPVADRARAAGGARLRRR